MNLDNVSSKIVDGLATDHLNDKYESQYDESNIKYALKFRAWSVDYKQFVYFSFDDLESMQSFWGNHGLAENEVWEFQRFTGMVDKSGVDIYEGDIIRDETCNGDEWAITWCDECMGYASSGTDRHGHHSNFPCISLEKSFIVVGNIYQE